MTQIMLSEVKNQLLTELVYAVLHGEKVLIKESSGQIVELVPVKKRVRTFGSLKGKIQMADDFDEPLAEFADYMP